MEGDGTEILSLGGFRNYSLDFFETSHRAVSPVFALSAFQMEPEDRNRTFTHDETLNLAYRTLRTLSNMKWFGIVERWEESLKLLECEFGWQGMSKPCKGSLPF